MATRSTERRREEITAALTVFSVAALIALLTGWLFYSVIPNWNGDFPDLSPAQDPRTPKEGRATIEQRRLDEYKARLKSDGVTTE